MDVDVKFPSPTPFLTRSPVVNCALPPILATRKTAKHPPVPNKKSSVKAHTVQDGVIAKPKQSKSRNGMLEGLLVLALQPFVTMCVTALCADELISLLHRLHNMQEEKIKM